MGKSMNVRTAIVTAGLLLGGCGLLPGNDYVTEDHLKKGNIKQTDANSFQEYQDSVNNPADAAKARAYITRGVNLTRTACYTYLDALAKHSNNAHFAKDQFLITTVLATGILALTNAGTDAFTGIALGSAFTVATADNIRDHYLLGPDSDAIVALVKSSMAAVDNEIKAVPPDSFDEAFENLQSYSRLCASSDIRRLVRAAIQRAEPRRCGK